MAALLFITFIVMLLLGVPVAFSIVLSSVTVMAKGNVQLLMVVQKMFTSTDSFSLIAVPFFIFAGDLMAKGKVSKVLVEFAEALLGMIKGGLSIVSILAGMFFAAISGSGAATTAAVGATLIPELKKRGYDEARSAALIAAAGTIGVVIPPSVPMVLYAVIAEQSVIMLYRLPKLLHVSPHTARKVYAVEQYRRTGDLKRVQRLLQHDNESVTAIYAMADYLTARKLGRVK